MANKLAAARRVNGREDLELFEESTRAQVFAIFGHQRRLTRNFEVPLDFRVDITSSMAGRLLDIQSGLREQYGHPIQRRIVRARLGQYCRDMSSNRWTPSSAAFEWSWEGRLQNGQHRLTMIVETGVTLPCCLVVLDQSPAAMPNIDGGVTRKEMDRLHISGLSGWARSTDLAIIKFLNPPGSTKNPVGARRLTTAECEERLAQYQEGLLFARDAFPRKVPRITIAPIQAAVVKAYYGTLPEQHERLREFAYVLVEGFGNGQADMAAVVLSRYLFRNANRCTGSMRETEHRRAQVAIRAFLASEPRRTIKAALEDVYPLDV